MGETEMCFLHIFLYAHKTTQSINCCKPCQSFAFVFFFLDVLVRFSSQCELTNNCSNNTKKLSDFLYNLINLKKPNIWVMRNVIYVYFV